MRHKQTGFTLIELMVVIAIIAILAALSLPNYQDRIVRQQVQDAIAFTEFARVAIQDFYAKTHRLPKDNIEAGLPVPNKVIGNFVTQVQVENGAINMQFGNRTNQALNGKWLTLRPGTVAGETQVPISWLCGNAHPVVGLIYAGTNRTELTPETLPLDCRL